MLDFTPTGESEERYIQRLPGQMANAIRRVAHYHAAFQRYGMELDNEARDLLEQLYGEVNPGAKAEQDYQKARKG